MTDKVWFKTKRRAPLTFDDVVAISLQLARYDAEGCLDDFHCNLPGPSEPVEIWLAPALGVPATSIRLTGMPVALKCQEAPPNVNR